MSADRNARHHAEAFRWWQGNPEMTETEAGLRDLKELSDATNQLLIEAVGQARDDGMSWTAIGESLGMTRQAVTKRYASKI